jgi:DNA polymerase-3 subunit alpha
MPDIDIDFSVRGRERVIRYVQEKYGRECVAQIITFGKMAPRQATRDAARVLGFDYAAGDRLAKQIPEPIMGRNPSFADCLKSGEELKRTYDSEPDARRILDVAQGLEGIVRANSIHAAAVVIADRPLTEIVPLQLAGGPRRGRGRGGARTGSKRARLQDSDPVLDKPIEEIGLLKIVSGCAPGRARAVAIISAWATTASTWACRSRIPGRRMLARGGQGVPAESRACRGAARVGPTEFGDIVSSSLYRPGPMRFIKDYARGKHPATVATSRPPAAITEHTCSIAVWERLMRIARGSRAFPAPRRTPCAARS